MYFLGVIQVPMGAAKNNKTTAVPFTIGSETKALYLDSDTVGVQFELGFADDFATTAARGAFIPGVAHVTAGPFRAMGAARIVGIWNPTGGTVNVRVWGSPTS